MNNFPFPYMPNSYQQNNPYQQYTNIEAEIMKLRQEIKILKEKVAFLEKKEKNDYLKKEDGLYMI